MVKARKKDPLSQLTILLGYTSFQLNIQYAFSCFRKILLGLLEVELINCAVCVSTI